MGCGASMEQSDADPSSPQGDPSVCCFPYVLLNTESKDESLLNEDVHQEVEDTLTCLQKHCDEGFVPLDWFQPTPSCPTPDHLLALSTPAVEQRLLQMVSQAVEKHEHFMWPCHDAFCLQLQSFFTPTLQLRQEVFEKWRRTALDHMMSSYQVIFAKKIENFDPVTKVLLRHYVDVRELTDATPPNINFVVSRVRDLKKSKIPLITKKFNDIPNIIMLLSIEFESEMKQLNTVPEIIRRYSFCTKLSKIGSSFYKAHPNINYVDFCGTSTMTELQAGLFFGCPKLQKVELVGTALQSIEKIGHDVLLNCPELTHVCCSGLVNVRSIGNHFLAEASKLKSFDISSMVNLESIGNQFLFNCAVEGLSLRQLQKLKTIGKQFCAKCSLKSFECEGLVNVTSIDDNFLQECGELQSIVFKGLDQLESIGGNFLYNCIRLRSLSFEGMKSLKIIGDWFLRGTANVTHVDFKALSNVEKIGDHFLDNRVGLEIVDFDGLSSVTEVGDNFLRDCNTLETVSFEGLTQLRTIGNDFMRGCTSLSSVHFKGLENVTSIGNAFLYGCFHLEYAELHALHQVKTVGDEFLGYCISLQQLNCEGMDALTVIGNKFLSGNTGLSQLDLTGLSNVHTLGSEPFFKCTQLKLVEKHAVPMEVWSTALEKAGVEIVGS